jgi:hypothetical protein
MPPSLALTRLALPSFAGLLLFASACSSEKEETRGFDIDGLAFDSGATDTGEVDTGEVDGGSGNGDADDADGGGVPDGSGSTPPEDATSPPPWIEGYCEALQARLCSLAYDCDELASLRERLVASGLADAEACSPSPLAGFSQGCLTDAPSILSGGRRVTEEQQTSCDALIAGLTCEQASTKGFGADCLPAPRSEPTVETGAACERSYDCISPRDVCAPNAGGSSVCTSRDGAVCNVGAEFCGSGQFCQAVSARFSAVAGSAGTCADRPLLGQPCRQEDACAQGQFCGDPFEVDGSGQVISGTCVSR